MDKLYTNQQLIKLAFIFILILSLLKISPYVIYFLPVLLVYTLVKNNVEYTYGFLMLLLTLSIVNTVIVKKDFSFYLVTRGSIFFLAGALALRSGALKNAWLLSPFYILIAYMLYMMMVSLGGWAPLVSELKAILFLVAFVRRYLQVVSESDLHPEQKPTHNAL